MSTGGFALLGPIRWPSRAHHEMLPVDAEGGFPRQLLANQIGWFTLT